MVVSKESKRSDHVRQEGAMGRRRDLPRVVHRPIGQLSQVTPANVMGLSPLFCETMVRD